MAWQILTVFTVKYQLGENNAVVNAFIQAGGKAVWHYLIFEHNQHQVGSARALAEELGFAEFVPKATSRFVAQGLFETRTALRGDRSQPASPKNST